MVTTGYPNGGNSPYTAAQLTQQTNASKANQLAKIGGKTKKTKRQKRRIKKSRKKRKNRKKGGSIVVPTVQTLYTDRGVGDQSVNGNITSLTKTSGTMNENSKYDACIGKDASCTMALK